MWNTVTGKLGREILLIINMNGLISVLVMMLLSQDSILIEQHNATVPVYDVDSYIYELPDVERSKISKNNKRLSKDIITMLNVNIVYHYLGENDLLELDYFKEVIDANKSMTIDLDESFANLLGITFDDFKNNFRKYLLKRALYKRLKSYLSTQIDDVKVEKFAHDRFSITKHELMTPEKRDIGMIKLSQERYKQTDVLEMVKTLRSDDTIDKFKDIANQFSQDNTVKYNDGQLGQFHQEGFRYPFANKVFSSEVGTIPAVFEKGGFWYIVRVNNIIDAKPAQFEEFKAEMIAKIREEMMERKFQSIIDEYAQHDVKINQEKLDDIFSRYEVFR